jgi:dolichol-phosphate mannosyltransferase
MFEGHRVAVVVPAYCEERLLPRTVGQVPKWVDEIVIVDDGSPDRTFEVARALAELDERVAVVRLGFNRGVGAAIVAGYRHALNTGADAIAVMAGDAQMDPADLPGLLKPVVRGEADYAKGDRLSHDEAHRMPVIRRLGTGLLGRLTGVVAGIPGLRDSQCGYTVVSATVLRRLPLRRLYPRYGYPNDLLIRLSEAGARVAQPVVRPVYADEISGLKIGAIIGPISGILARGVARRASVPARRLLVAITS